MSCIVTHRLTRLWHALVVDDLREGREDGTWYVLHGGMMDALRSRRGA